MRNIWFLSPLFLSKRENLALLSLNTFWGKRVYVLFDIIVNFIIQKLKKNTHTFLKKYTNWAKLSSLVLTEREETKTRYLAPLTLDFQEQELRHWNYHLWCLMKRNFERSKLRIYSNQREKLEIFQTWVSCQTWLVGNSYDRSLKARPCPFIQILSRFYLNFIQIKSG